MPAMHYDMCESVVGLCESIYRTVQDEFTANVDNYSFILSLLGGNSVIRTSTYRQYIYILSI